MIDENSRNFEYFAFISYKREDRKWAKWLQKELESYSLPVSIRKNNPNLPSKIRPIFRDESDLSGGNLTREIENNLEGSKYLIVICSPLSAQSPWVSKEIQYFIEQGRSEYIIPFIVRGTPFSSSENEECFPQSLRSLRGDSELLGINVNEIGRNAAVVKVIARMFDIRFDSLWRRYEKEKFRNRLITVILLALTLLMGVVTFLYIDNQKKEREAAQSAQHLQHLYNEYLVCEKMFNDERYSQAFKAGKNIMLNYADIPDTLHSKFEYILRMSYAALQTDTLKIVNRYKAEFPAMDWGEMPIKFNKDGSKVWIGCNGFTEIDVKTGKCLNRAGFWPQKFILSGDKILTFDDYGIATYDIKTLSQERTYKLSSSSDDYQMIISPSADGRRFLTRDTNTEEFRVFDTGSGNLIITFKGKYGLASINHNGNIVAFSENGKLRLFDISNNRFFSDVEDFYASDLQFDESGKWLLMYLENYNCVHVYNPDTKESYFIEDIAEPWYSSYNFDGNSYGNKYIVSDDDRFVAIGTVIYDLYTREPFKKLEHATDAMGLRIFPGASKVIQINLEQEIIEYSRSGKPMFDSENVDFIELLNRDKTPDNYLKNDIGYGSVTIKEKTGKTLGEIKGIDGDIYHISVSPDKKYVLINSQAIPTSLYDLSTGTLVQKFPFNTGDGYDGFGVFGENGYIYFCGTNTVFKYKLPSVENLLNTEVN